jgi:hypothetical protein
MDSLNENQLKERAINKIHAKIFFAKHKLEEIRLEVEGIIPSKIHQELLEGNYSSQNNEVKVLEYIMSKININI